MGLLVLKIMELGLPYSFHFWRGESEGGTFLFIVAVAVAVAVALAVAVAVRWTYSVRYT